MEAVIRGYLHVEPSKEMEGFLRQYVVALWLEERAIDVMAAGMAKALGGKDN